MSTDQIVATIALSGMLLVVIQRLVSRELPMRDVARLALLWTLIFAGLAGVAYLIGPGLTDKFSG